MDNEERGHSDKAVMNDMLPGAEQKQQKKSASLPGPIPNISWVSCADFTVDIGTRQIEEFVQTWTRGDLWLHCVDTLDSECGNENAPHNYRVRFSTPSSERPVPQATASVFFTIAVSLEPSDKPVDVKYVFETNQLIHRPGLSRFHEKWLNDIIETKNLFIEGLSL
uniref:A-kinase anchor protein 14 isoform X2 n=1 Tax=Myxine glutinosa TaxID=7769 RepID=UPI00358F19DB